MVLVFRPPLWLICDAPALLRLFAAMWTLFVCFNGYVIDGLTRGDRSKLTGANVHALCVALAGAEAAIRWAIVRQARRIAGLNPDGVEIAPRDLPETFRRFWGRHRAFIAMCRRITPCARRLAARIEAARHPAVDSGARNPSPQFASAPMPAANPAATRALDLSG